MHPSWISLVIVAVVLGMVTKVEAKRSAPPKVTAVRIGNVEYRVTHEINGRYFPGVVEAYDVSRKGTLWYKQIYVIRRDPELEGDVQDVFITELKQLTPTDSHQRLEVRNEAGGRFILDLQSLDVKPLEGSAVIGK